MKKLLPIGILLLILVVVSCTKIELDDTDKDYPIELQVVQKDSRTIKLTWTKTNISSFSEYIIVRSPIPIETDDFASVQFNVVQRIDDFEENTFEDAALPLEPKLYYKVFVDLGDRMLTGPAVEMENTKKIIFARPTKVLHYPDLNSFLIYDGSSNAVHRYDYVQDSILKTVSVGGWNAEISVGMNGGIRELYIVQNSSSQVKVYNLESFDFRHNISNNTGYAIHSATFNGTNRLITAESDPSKTLKIYSVSSRNYLGGFNLSNSYDFRRTAMVNNSPNQFVEASTQKLNYYDVDLSNITLNSQSSKFVTPLAVLDNIAVSPDGQYFIAHADGAIRELDLSVYETIGGIDFNSQYSDFVFSSDGTRIFAKHSFQNIIEEYSFPDVQLLNTYEFGYTVKRIFYHNNKLMVIGEGFTGFSVVTVLDEIKF